MDSHEFEYFSSPESFNWLDAMSSNKANFDPRTYEIHQTAWTRYPARWNSRLVSTSLEQVGTGNTRAFVQNWVQNTRLIAETEGFDPVTIEDIGDFEGTDESMSDLGELDELRIQFPLQLEAMPPYPKQFDSRCNGSLFETHMQIYRQDNYCGLSEWSSGRTMDSEHYVSHQRNSETNTIALSSKSPTRPLIGFEKEPNIGNVIADKFRQAFVQGMEAYQGFIQSRTRK
ncbi:hypothetical protein N7454_004375 [Penicillium verhagenii]|nr:hypothetical protein N7454_004375 [Penicillium verhagenii]